MKGRRTYNKNIEFIKKMISLLKENYIYPKKIKSLKKYIMENMDKYKKLSKTALRNKLYDDIQLILEDKHVAFFPKKLDTNKDNKEYVKFLQTEWMKNRIINDKIGYIQFNNFYNYPKDVLIDIVLKAYNKIRNWEIVVFDLIENSGGSPILVQFMQSFLFEEKILLNSLYWRIKGTNKYKVDKFYTFTKKELHELTKSEDLPLLYDKKVFVLISSKTFSAAEEFAYI